ncbi:MAG: MBL fold metallo-hydrolase [Desulfobacterales bacterium]
MDVTFHGAVREVTGSLHSLTTATDRVLLDCGLFQGRRKESEARNRVLPFDPQIVANVILSHAHIDHSGRIPLLVKDGFNGRVFCTRATAAASSYLLPDSAHIQESDADYLNYKTLRGALNQMKPSKRKEMNVGGRTADVKQALKKNRHELDAAVINDLMDRLRLEKIEPLYTDADARNALAAFDGTPYRYPVAVGTNMTCSFYDAGHILGSAISMVRVEENGRPVTVCYTGDLGRYDKPIVRNPVFDFEVQHRNVDLMIMESTYGDRTHAPVAALKPQLEKIVTETVNRRGTVLIPAFAFGRTQELLYVLHQLYDEKAVPRVPIYVDSPLAVNITRVFGEHPEVYDRDAQETFLKNGQNPFSFDQVHFVASVEESMRLNREKKPHIVLAASGMCEAGRILHHLRHKIHDERNTILIVGFMAQNTLGRRIFDEGTAYERSGRSGPPPLLKFLNKTYPLKAHVTSLGGFSAHGDKHELLRFLKDSNLNIKRIAVVHGEEDQALAFAGHLRENGYAALVPKRGETIRL